MGASRKHQKNVINCCTDKATGSRILYRTGLLFDGGDGDKPRGPPPLRVFRNVSVNGEGGCRINAVEAITRPVWPGVVDKGSKRRPVHVPLGAG